MAWGGIFGGKQDKGKAFPWKQLTDINQWNELLKASDTRPQLVFKHSTRCSISSMALERFEREWNPETEADVWYLDLLQHRNISNAIAEHTGVMHQSPQAMLIDKGEVRYQASHSAISSRDIVGAIGQ